MSDGRTTNGFLLSQSIESLLAQVLADTGNVRESNKVRILKFQNKTKATEAARRLLNEARQKESVITKELKSIAKSNSAKMVGLDDRFKSEKSLVRKLNDIAEIKISASIENEAKQIDDALRYTMILSDDGYQSGFETILRKLENKGFRIDDIWNSWAAEGTQTQTGYRGINVSVISSQKQKFELQIHTEDSFRIKTETQDLYEERRNP